MDRMQIGFKLALDFLGIQIRKDESGEIVNYREICNIAYIAKTRGVNISPSRVKFNPQTGQAYSPLSHEYSGWPSWNLYRDLEEIIFGSEEQLKVWTFDEGITRKLSALRNELNKEKLGKILEEAALAESWDKSLKTKVLSDKQ